MRKACKVVLLVVLSLLFTVHCQDADDDPYSSLPLSIQLSTAVPYYLSWGITPDNSTIQFQLTLETWAWVGIGWHAPGSSDSEMKNGDFIVTTFDTSYDGKLVSVKDYYCTCSSNGAPSVDLIDNVINYSGVQYLSSTGTQITTVQFSRLAVTNDTTQDHPLVPDQTTQLIWAFGSTSEGNPNFFTFHDNNAGVFNNFNFFSGIQEVSVGKDYTYLKYWHGCVMTIAFGFCMSVGIFLPRYMKSFWWWFPLHIVLQISGVILAMTGLVISLIMSNGNHFAYAHCWVGIITLALAFVTPLLGTSAHFTWNPNRKSIPIFPDQVHWWFGRITIVLSWVAIIMGMRLYGIPYQIDVAFGFVLLSYVLTYIWLDIMKIKEIGFRAYLLGTHASHDFGTDVKALID